MVIAFDLDDTLFFEIDFVRSAYQTIAKRYGGHLLAGMLSALTPADAFDSTGIPIEELLSIYRTHFPDIRLPWQSLYTLSVLRRQGHKLALITDGRELTQRNKIEALGLGRFFEPSNVFISESFGHLKTDGEAFRALMSSYPGEIYMYIGDNPAKDIAAPRSLGWTTVCIRDSGQNVHRQDFTLLSPDYILPSVLNLLDIVPLEQFHQKKHR
ncbi:MAG: HAD family hydrolase [Duncaniella sp.]|nr:HAD family hydrolase [Duncaniella sp.]